MPLPSRVWTAARSPVPLPQVGNGRSRAGRERLFFSQPRGWESKLKAFLFRCLQVGWKVEESLSRVTHAEKLMSAEQKAPVACQRKRTGSSALPREML